MQPIEHNLVGQEFVPASRVANLPAGEIHLWFWHSDEPLPPRELASRARFKLIRLLQHYADSSAEPAIEAGEHGKPFVAAADYPHFNMSHSGDCVMFAFSRDHELGVDIEAPVSRRRFSTLELAARFFTADESTMLAALDEKTRDAAFMQLWTCKEAVLKALGHGLSFGLDRLQFALDSNASACSLDAIAEEAGVPEDWQIHRFMPGQGLLGSLAWRGLPQRIKTYAMAANAFDPV